MPTGRLNEVAPLTVSMSVGTLDEEVRRVVEPGTPPARKRLEILGRFAEAGIRTGVLVAPVLPGLTDDEEHLDEVLAACAEAGVSWASVDRPPRAAGDPRALHAVAEAGLPVALSALRRALRQPGLRPEGVPGGRRASASPVCACGTASPPGGGEPSRRRQEQLALGALERPRFASVRARGRTTPSTKHWYPKEVKSAEARLRYYAEHFSTVEVDSTYYRLPDETMVSRWEQRTPDGFVMHVKAFGVMTRHPVKAEQLPPDIREAAPLDDRGRVDRPPREFRAEVFRRFHQALEPLRETGKLGGILLQFPLLRRLQGCVRSTTCGGPSSSSTAIGPWSSSATGAGWTRRTATRRSPSSRSSAPRTSSSTRQDGGEEPRPHRRRGHQPARLRPLPRAQRRHLERARRQRQRPLRLPLLRGGARGVGRAAPGARGRTRTRCTSCSTTTGGTGRRRVSSRRRRRRMRQLCKES